MPFLSLIQKELLTRVGGPLFPLASLALDSRKVEPGDLFVAIPGFQKDGSFFVEEALQKGSLGILAPTGVGRELWDQFKDAYPSVGFFETENIRKTASLLAAAFYSGQPETMVAVTGTNGKTSTVSFLRQLWGHLGVPAASLGTLGLVIEGGAPPPPTGTEGLNTPDQVTFYQILQRLHSQGVNHVAFEASSHGIHQHRLDGVGLRAAIFTNFSPDHLDYHSTLDAYFEAKTRLFTEVVGPQTWTILNTEIAHYDRLTTLCQARSLKVVSFGRQGNLVQLLDLSPHPQGQEVTLSIAEKHHTFLLPLVGEFQVYNMMAALSAALVCGADVIQLLEACLTLRSVPGRLQQAAPGVYVDYAHTPDGLSVALKALRSHTQGKLWVVFGCGGDRDALKRPLMGEIAATLADHVIVTDDNPRYENPETIRKQILAKCPNASDIPDRREAIRTALAHAQESDVVLIAGKGHELYQLIEGQSLFFNDVDEVQKARRF